MNVKRFFFKVALVLLLVALFVLAIMVTWQYLASGKPEMPPPGGGTPAATSTVPVVAGEKAFVTIDRADASVPQGGAWTVDISSNTWSSCLADLYAPDEKVSVFKDPKDAEAAMTGDGKFTWTWHVPADAAKGSWTVRILCGTYEHLASRDATVEVK